MVDGSLVLHVLEHPPGASLSGQYRHGITKTEGTGSIPDPVLDWIFSRLSWAQSMLATQYTNWCFGFWHRMLSNNNLGNAPRTNFESKHHANCGRQQACNVKKKKKDSQ